MHATRKAAESRRKLIEFDQETWQALDLLGARSRSRAFRNSLRRPFATSCASMDTRPT